MDNNKNRVKEMYFDLGWKPVDIASELNVSKAAVSKILAEFGEAYKNEKEKRKELNKQNNRSQTIKYIKEKRKDDTDLYQAIRREHEQAVMGMSKGRKMSTLSIVMTYIQAYDNVEYNNERRLKFNENRCGKCPKGMVALVPKNLGVI